MHIENSVELVTGANRGLGKTYTDALLAAGAAKVYAGARDAPSVAITDNRLVPVKLDVTQDKDVHAAAAACADVNLLINNAGIMLASTMLSEDSESALRAEMEVNVFGMPRMVRAFAPVLAKNGSGAIAKDALPGELVRLSVQRYLLRLQTRGPRSDRGRADPTEVPMHSHRRRLRWVHRHRHGGRI